MKTIINILLVTITGAMLATAFTVALQSIDNITARDCERGIKEACKYLPTNNK